MKTLSILLISFLNIGFMLLAWVGFTSSGNLFPWSVSDPIRARILTNMILLVFVPVFIVLSFMHSLFWHIYYKKWYFSAYLFTPILVSTLALVYSLDLITMNQTALFGTGFCSFLLYFNSYILMQDFHKLQNFS